jgi:mono/diheme cytochrome c family protein
MDRNSIHLWLLVAFLGLTLWPEAALAQRAKLRADLEEGQRLYKQNCITCHGAEGRGDGVAADKLDPKPADLTSAQTQGKKDAELLETIKFGRPGTAMQSWMNELDEREMQNVLAYLRSLVR